MIKTTEHPDWVIDFLEYLQPYKDRVVNNKFFEAINEGTLSKKQFQGALINFYPLIESFPKYMALNLAKVPPGGSKWSKRTRLWLITNMNIERLHTSWWRNFAVGFGVPEKTLDDEIYPPPEMDAINSYLWRICTHGSLAEGISAANYAIEGPTGEWTRKIRDSFKQYAGVEDVDISEKTLEWVAAHASYDDKHPYEALEIIKAYTTTPEMQKKVKLAAQRAMEYYALALETCYQLFE